MNEAEVVERMALIADDQPAEVAEPSDEPLNLPPASIPPEWTPILGLRANTAPAMRRNHLDPRVASATSKGSASSARSPMSRRGRSSRNRESSVGATSVLS
jgi:hypothetical protein